VIDHIHARGGALLVRGEAGIGKSALLGRARERVRAMGARVLSTVGVELEVELAFAGLHQLLHPIIGLTERLSEAQRRAIDAARLPVLERERLSAWTAATLLDERAPELHPILRARVLSEAAGNPLAIVELARTAASSSGEHRQIAPAPTSLTARLEQAFASQ